MVCRSDCMKVSGAHKAQWLSWLERRPVTAEAVGSSPSWVVFLCLTNAWKERMFCLAEHQIIAYCIWADSRVAKGDRL